MNIQYKIHKATWYVLCNLDINKPSEDALKGIVSEALDLNGISAAWAYHAGPKILEATRLYREHGILPE